MSLYEWRKSQKMIGFGCNVDALIDAYSWECENMDEEWLAWMKCCIGLHTS